MIATDTGQIVLDALESRRSMKRAKPDQPPRELVERVIEAGGWAPNHYRTQPWRFTVLAGDARERLGEVMVESLRSRLGEDGITDDDPRLEKERAKPLRAPVVIVAAAIPSDLPKAREIEDIEATAVAVQNMLLAAEALGLGAMWRTGEPAYDPAVKRFLGLPENAHIVSFVYLGYADDVPEFERRRDATRHARWLGWD